MFKKIKETVAALKSSDICCTGSPCDCPEHGNYPYQDLVPDKVNHPEHYCKGKIEVVEIILDQKLDYLLGNVIKYVCRSQWKGEEVEDLKKAIWYLNKKIEVCEQKKK